MAMMARKSPLLLFRSLTTSPMRPLSLSCSPRFLSLPSKEKAPAYHRSEDDEPSIRSRLSPREKGSRDDHRTNVEKSKTIPGRHVVTLTFKPFARGKSYDAHTESILMVSCNPYILSPVFATRLAWYLGLARILT